MAHQMTRSSDRSGDHATLSACIVIALALFVAGMGSAVQAAEPYGKIGEKYAKLGGRGGPLGPAIGDEVDAPYGGRLHYFKEGMILWHPQIGEAYAVWGAISVKFHEMGRVEYGYPITDESPTPDGRGRFNHFRAMHLSDRPEVSIYWTPQTGAHAVYGAIRDAWARGGWERGELGYPTSDEFQWGKYRRSDFERGHILWAPDTGIQIVKSGAAIIARTPPNTFSTILVNGMEIAIKGNPIAGNTTFLSENTVCGLYDQQLARINETLKNHVRSTVNPRMGDFSIHSNASMHMTADCSFRAEIVTACSSAVKVRLFLPRNRFFFQVTTPTVYGPDADPKFTVDFDVEATATLLAPQNGSSPIGLSPSNVSVSNVKFDSRNVTGDVALVLADVSRYFTGRDLIGQLTQDRMFTFDGITRTLASLNPALARIPPNYRIESCIVGDTLRLNGTDAPLPPPPVIR